MLPAGLPVCSTMSALVHSFWKMGLAAAPESSKAEVREAMEKRIVAETDSQLTSEGTRGTK